MPVTDEVLVARARMAGDTEAFGELVRRHQGRVRGWLRTLAADHATADDIAQEAFVRAWSKLDSFLGQSRFATWLMKIAYNEFLMSQRRRGQRRRRDERLRADRHAGEAVVTPGLADEVTDVPRVLAILSDDERSVMLLVYAWEFTHAEASAVTGIPLGTVKSHLRRGKQRILKRFSVREASHG